MNNLIAELRRRNVFRVAGSYAVVGWVLAQASGVLENALGLPAWFDTLVVSLLLLAFPIALFLAWAFELTPEGIKPTQVAAEDESITTKTGRKLDYIILTGLLLVAALVLWQIMRNPSFEARPDGLTPQDEASSATNPKPHAEVRSPDILGGALKDVNTNPASSIAVLPFEDFSAANDQEYFANGISEELLNVLARMDGLRVVSRTSAFAFKGKEVDISEIASALNVGYVLEGSIRKAGKTVRITAQLIDTQTDQHLWSETYDRPLDADNIFTIQDEIAAAIVDELKGRLNIVAATAPKRTSSLPALEFYLRARELMRKRSPKSLRDAITNYSQAIALDPDYGLAYAGRADTYLLMRDYTDMPEEEGLRLAKVNVEKALKLAPNSAEALTAAAFLALGQQQDEKALALANKAITANPSYSDAYLRKAFAYFSLTEPQKELATLRKARSLDPLSGVILNNIAAAYSDLGDRDAAKRANRDNIRWNPNSIFGYTDLAFMLMQEGDYPAAHKLLRQALTINAQDGLSQKLQSDLYMRLGMFEQALAVSDSEDTMALAAQLGGNPLQAKQMLSADGDSLAAAYVYYLMREYPASKKAFLEAAEQYHWLDNEILPEFVHIAAKAAWVLQQEKDPSGSVLQHRVEDILGNKAPENFTLVQELQAGAILQILQKKPQLTRNWIKRYLDLGFADIAFLQEPVFDDLRGSAEFKAWETHMSKNVSRHRSEILAQLAHPAPNRVNQ